MYLGGGSAPSPNADPLPLDAEPPWMQTYLLDADPSPWMHTKTLNLSAETFEGLNSSCNTSYSALIVWAGLQKCWRNSFSFRLHAHRQNAKAIYVWMMLQFIKSLVPK